MTPRDIEVLISPKDYCPFSTKKSKDYFHCLVANNENVFTTAVLRKIKSWELRNKELSVKTVRIWAETLKKILINNNAWPVSH